MQKNLYLLVTLLLFSIFLSGASALYSITDMNISVSDGQAMVYVECYDETGTKTASPQGVVWLTVYDMSNPPHPVPFSTDTTGRCGYYNGPYTLSPGNYYVISEVVGANCNPAGICSYKQSFVVPKKFHSLDIDETQPALLVFLLPIVLFLVKRESKKS
ncbi:MAG: hypothetical protein DRO07_02915 [Candidatus Iainarchaeum archaeon]|uniref:Uncharacterized protein n=1 Tax=Candidatus Iainarchaeum sp. TaxID=3101447 RepID=A0A497JGG5_9ARCH|nr:MAG: hypothetical protein DRO07_02915 [Candidatus Diapherotrites archaeon]